MSFLQKCQFKPFAQFSIGLFCCFLFVLCLFLFLLLSSMGSLYILGSHSFSDIQSSNIFSLSINHSFSDIQCTNTFSLSIDCPLTLLIASFTGQKPFRLAWSHLFIFCSCCLNPWCHVQKSVVKASVKELSPRASSCESDSYGLVSSPLWAEALCLIWQTSDFTLLRVDI